MLLKYHPFCSIDFKTKPTFKNTLQIAWQSISLLVEPNSSWTLLLCIHQQRTTNDQINQQIELSPSTMDILPTLSSLMVHPAKYGLFWQNQKNLPLISSKPSWRNLESVQELSGPIKVANWLAATPFGRSCSKILDTLLNQWLPTALPEMVVGKYITTRWQLRFELCSTALVSQQSFGQLHSYTPCISTTASFIPLPTRPHTRDGMAVNPMSHTSKLLVPGHVWNAWAPINVNWTNTILRISFWVILRRIKISFILNWTPWLSRLAIMLSSMKLGTFNQPAHLLLSCITTLAWKQKLILCWSMARSILHLWAPLHPWQYHDHLSCLELPTIQNHGRLPCSVCLRPCLYKSLTLPTPLALELRKSQPRTSRSQKRLLLQTLYLNTSLAQQIWLWHKFLQTHIEVLLTRKWISANLTFSITVPLVHVSLRKPSASC